MKIRMRLDADDIDRAIREIERYRDSLKEKANRLCKTLAERGYEVAGMILTDHIFSGDTIASLHVEERGENKYALCTDSDAILFLEFGAGLNGGGHPLAGKFGMGPGTWSEGPEGKGHWADPGGWWYKTDDPRLTVYTNEKTGQSYGHSRGNPPYMPMYNASQDLRRELIEIAREVFADDRH